MGNQIWRWGLGLIYIVAVATIWIAASYVVQSVVDAGVSPFLITYICNSLFIVYLPIAEIGRYVENSAKKIWFWGGGSSSSTNVKSNSTKLDGSEEVVLLEDGAEMGVEFDELEGTLPIQDGNLVLLQGFNGELDEKRRWTRTRIAKVSLLICPFWFLAQLTFNISLKYTSVTSNSILSTSSSLFTFLAALVFLGESFTWVKLVGVLLCMGGTIVVSLGDSESGATAVAINPLLGDILALVSTLFYSIYVTLVRKKLPDEESEKDGKASMAEFLGYIGLCNLLIFSPVALILYFTKLEPFHLLTWKQLGLIVGKGLLDNVLSDYLWAKAVLMTSTTVATAGLSIQVPLAAVVDSLTGQPPHLMDYLGALSVMLGFVGLNVPTDACCNPKDAGPAIEEENHIMEGEAQGLRVSKEVAIS